MAKRDPVLLMSAFHLQTFLSKESNPDRASMMAVQTLNVSGSSFISFFETVRVERIVML